jgi:hypothetical protein
MQLLVFFSDVTCCAAKTTTTSTKCTSVKDCSSLSSFRSAPRCSSARAADALQADEKRLEGQQKQMQAELSRMREALVRSNMELEQVTKGAVLRSSAGEPSFFDVSRRLATTTTRTHSFLSTTRPQVRTVFTRSAVYLPLGFVLFVAFGSDAWFALCEIRCRYSRAGLSLTPHHPRPRPVF